MIHYGLAGIMPAHVVYSRVDPQPAGFSRFWLREVLRRQLQFQGVIFSDDLSMEGAKIAGGVVARARAALAAGCDMALVCNDPAAGDAVLDGLGPYEDPVSHLRLVRMHGRGTPTRRELLADATYQGAVRMVTKVV
jgi:beta-N-acetylhexosaminidase